MTYRSLATSHGHLADIIPIIMDLFLAFTQCEQIIWMVSPAAQHLMPMAVHVRMRVRDVSPGTSLGILVTDWNIQYALLGFYCFICIILLGCSYCQTYNLLLGCFYFLTYSIRRGIFYCTTYNLRLAVFFTFQHTIFYLVSATNRHRVSTW